MKHPVYSQRAMLDVATFEPIGLYFGSSELAQRFLNSVLALARQQLTDEAEKGRLETPEHMLVMLPSRLACEKTRHGDVTGSRVVIAHTGAYWTSCQVQSEWSTIPALCSSLQWIKQTLVPGLWDLRLTDVDVVDLN